MFNNHKNLVNIHVLSSLLFIVCILIWLFNGSWAQNYPEKIVYEGAELRFTNVINVRTSDYVIKGTDNQFLIAQNIPRELRLAIEFKDAGNYSALISAQYPDWLCQANELDKASVRINGGSANDFIKLIQGQSEEITFSIAKGQAIQIMVQNPDNSQCGRAIVTFYKDNQKEYFVIGFSVFWLLLFVFCLVIAISPYVCAIGILTNTLLIGADVSIGTISSNTLIISAGLSMVVVALLMLFSALPKSRILSLVALGLVTYMLAFPLAFIAYDYVFSTPMSNEAIHGAMQSYDTQIIEFWQEFVGKKRTLIFLLSLLILYFGIRHINGTKVNFWHGLIYSGLLFIFAGTTLAGRINENKMINLIDLSIIEYKWEIAAFKKIADQRINVTTKAKRLAAHQQDSTVVVIGESVNKKFMSSYGYVQETTPLLQKRIDDGDVVLYKNAYSNHTHSNPTMSYILTQANQYNRKKWLESPSVFNFAKSAYVATHWMTNHRLLGGWSNQITTIIREADRLETINLKIGYGLDSSNYDDALIPLYKEALAKHPYQINFLHLYNSHTNYCNRYPEDVKKFALELPKNAYGQINTLRKMPTRGIACYVNTIHYTDTVVEELIKELEQRSNPSTLIYVADHSEEVLGALAHNSAKFTFDMIDIPLFIWANKAWQKAHSDKWQNIKNNKNKVITNDLMFESILGLAGITSPSINLNNDLSSDQYQSLSKPLTLHGRMNVNHNNNWNYWQSQNSAFANEQDLQMVATDIESIGHAYIAAELGIKKLHLRTSFSLDNGIQLVSALEGIDIMSLDDFVDAISKKNIDTLLISLNEPDPQLNAHVFTEISNLEDKFGGSIELVPKTPNLISSLSSPDFQNELTKNENRFNKDNNKELWVTFNSRYTTSLETLTLQ